MAGLGHVFPAAPPPAERGPWTMVYNASRDGSLVNVTLNADPRQKRLLRPGSLVRVYQHRFGPVHKAVRRIKQRFRRLFQLRRRAASRARDFPLAVRRRVPGVWYRHRRPLGIVGSTLGQHGGPGNTYNYGGWYYNSRNNQWSRPSNFTGSPRHGR